ncbi:MAG: hypothetical protein SVY10_15650 [Thermodesulfobacteriota bacterium]|nr:hypothetical protein [Thermodesulfobacteriota bacterium]
MKKVAVFFVLFFTLPVLYNLSTEARADDIEFQAGITQSEFEEFTKELGSALSYKAVAPAEPLGTLGFDIGIDVTATDIDQGADYWEKSTEDNDMSDMLIIPKIYARKGLPFNIDVGAFYGKAHDSDITVLGAEVKYSILSGTVATPAVAVRGTYTMLQGVDQLDLSTYGIDLSISKGFLNLTPYGGIGAVLVSSNPKDLDSGIDLDDEDVTLVKYFAGIRITLFLLNITAEVEQIEVPTYSLRIGIVF